MFSKIIMYLTAIALGVLFALYLSADVGWIFVYVLVCAPLLSLGVTLFLHLRKSVTLTIDADRTRLYKRETVTLRFTAVNKSVFPAPAVKISLAAPEGLEPERKGVNSILISVPPRSETTVETVYRAKVWGAYRIGAEKALMYDFMGFFRFGMPAGNLHTEVKIYPDIPEMEGDAPLLRAAAENARFSDDSEDTKETDGMTRFAGMPGYTHREYTEGDPIRRINWKLSSKRDTYMVRLDDEIESVRQNIVLDSAGGQDVLENERAVEGLLAAALGLLRSGFECTAYCRFEGAWEGFEIAEPADISALQTRLADYRFDAGSNSRMPAAELAGDGGGAGILLFTSLFDRRLTAEISAAEEMGVFTAVISSDSVSVGSAYQVWRLNEDFSAELLGQ